MTDLRFPTTAPEEAPRTNGHTKPSLPADRPPERRDTLFAVAVVVAAIALVTAVVAVGIAWRAVDEGGSAGAAVAGAEEVTVTLTEFAIEPGTVEIAAGGTLRVVNGGSVPHDLMIEGTDLATPMLAAGEEAVVDLGDLAAGTYRLFCGVPGHTGAGMEGDLVVTGDAGGTAAGDGHEHSHSGGMSWQEMDEAMAARTKAFPAKTEGKGGGVLAPNVLPDGTKEFELTASVVKWEVEPGKVVDAWTYNGAVPGPTLKAALGDKIRVVLHNALPESTAIHFHGVRTPNAMDGVPDITQPPVKPGETFVYEFVANERAVGMYHSHHNAAHQVPAGLAGTILIGDIPLPEGVAVTHEIPMMLNDAGAIGYSINGKSFPATEPVVAAQGEWVLVHYLNEGVVSHPMHLHGLHQLVVAKDGYPLESPYYADTVNVAPGERYSVLVNADAPGTWAFHCHVLTHAESAEGMFGMVTAMVVK